MTLELQDTGQDVLELDFENPDKGVSFQRTCLVSST
jgi:hypothetical protein